MTTILTQVLIPVALVSVAAVLLLGLINMARGGNPWRSQYMMQMRVLLQFVALVIFMLAIWMMVGRKVRLVAFCTGGAELAQRPQCPAKQIADPHRPRHKHKPEIGVASVAGECEAPGSIHSRAYWVRAERKSLMLAAGRRYSYCRVCQRRCSGWFEEPAFLGPQIIAGGSLALRVAGVCTRRAAGAVDGDTVAQRCA